MHRTDIANPAYFHKVVDCQWACPAHTPVPEYIRLIAQGRYSDAYMINWVSNVFPGVLGRTCDRPCEPACRRSRVEENNGEHPEPVAICRLKRVAADMKDDVAGRMPKAGPKNGKRVACIGAGPASLTVARDLAPLGYDVTVFDGEAKAGGFIRTQIPRFRLPESVIDEETGYILNLGVHFRNNERVESMKSLMAQGYDADLRRLRRAARAQPGDSRPHRGRPQHPHRHRLAGLGVVRAHQDHRQARDRAGRRQHGDGLLPFGAAPGRHRREGDRAQRLRGNEGLALGKGRRDARGHPDHQFPRAQGLRAQERQAAGHELRDRQGGVRRQGPAQAGSHRPAGRLLRLRRGAGRRRAGERLPLDRARLRHRLRRVGPAGAEQGHAAVHGAQRLLRRRRGLRSQEHHHRGGPRPRGRGVDRPAAERRGRRGPARRR